MIVVFYFPPTIVSIFIYLWNALRNIEIAALISKPRVIESVAYRRVPRLIAFNSLPVGLHYFDIAFVWALLTHLHSSKPMSVIVSALHYFSDIISVNDSQFLSN